MFMSNVSEESLQDRPVYQANLPKFSKSVTEQIHHAWSNTHFVSHCLYRDHLVFNIEYVVHAAISALKVSFRTCLLVYYVFHNYVLISVKLSTECSMRYYTKILAIGFNYSIAGPIRSFLTNRHQCARSDTARSKYKPLEIGAPQGTNLGRPLLYMANICKWFISRKFLLCKMRWWHNVLQTNREKQVRQCKRGHFLTWKMI